MAVDGRAQVVHDPLADEVRQPGLPHPEHPGDDRDGHHPADERGEQRGVLLRDRRVEDASQQEGRDHAQAGGDGDQREHGAQPPPVGAEEPGDAPDVALGGLVGLGGD